MKTSSALFASAVFIFVHFKAVLILATSNNQGMINAKLHFQMTFSFLKLPFMDISGHQGLCF